MKRLLLLGTFLATFGTAYAQPVGPMDYRTLGTPNGPAKLDSGSMLPASEITSSNFAPLLASPPSIGSTTPNTGAFTTLSTTGNVTVAGTTITGFGSAIGQALGPLVSSGGGGLPMLSTGNRLIFRRATPAIADSEDFQFDRTTTFTGGSGGANINRVIGVNTTLGPNDSTQTSGILAIGTNNSTTGGLLPNFWSQAIRTAAGNGYISAGVFSTDDRSDESSFISGNGNASTEIDHMANGADDVVNSGRFGGAGGRSFMRFVGMRSNQTDTTPTEVSTALWITTAPSTFGSTGSDAYTSISQAIGFAINTQIRSALDTRGAITPTGSSNPVSAVTMTAGHIIDFNGGASLKSAPGRYLTYNSGGTKLQYMSGSTELFSVTDAGVASALGVTLAPLASPTLTGTPTAPTATALTSTTQLATTAFSTLAVGVETTRATAAEATLTAGSAPSSQDLIPSRHLSNLVGKTAATVCIIGDSTATPLALNGFAVDPSQTVWWLLQEKLRNANPQITSWTWGNFAIAASNEGNPLQTGTATGLTLPSWFATPGNTWLSYVQAQNCDVLFWQFGTNSPTAGSVTAANAGTLIRQNFEIINGWTKVPNIIIVTNKSTNPATDTGSLDDANSSFHKAQAAFHRSFALTNAAGYTSFSALSALGFGLVDLGRNFVSHVDGYDPAAQFLQARPDCVANGLAIGSALISQNNATTVCTTKSGDFRLEFTIPAGGGTTLFGYGGGNDLRIGLAPFLGNVIRLVIASNGIITPQYLVDGVPTAAPRQQGTNVATTNAQDVTFVVTAVGTRVQLTINGTLALDVAAPRFTTGATGGTPVNISFLSAPTGSPTLNVTNFYEGIGTPTLGLTTYTGAYGPPSFCTSTTALCQGGNSINHPRGKMIAMDKQVIDALNFAVPPVDPSYPTSTFAGLPSAATNSGVIYNVTNVGVGQSLWASDGTRWHPLDMITLGSGAVQVCHTGDATETAFATVTVPGNTMGSAGRVAIEGIWTYTGSTNSKTMRARFGGVGGQTVLAGVTSTLSNISYNNRLVVQNRAATNAQIAGIVNVGEGQTGFGTTLPTTATVDTTADTTVVFSGQLTSTGESVCLEHYSVELMP